MIDDEYLLLAFDKRLLFRIQFRQAEGRAARLKNTARVPESSVHNPKP